MIRFNCWLFALGLLLLVSNANAQPAGSELLEGKATDTAVILAHGVGGGPDAKVVSPLRKAINGELGFYTLSLQMPVLSTKEFKAYAPTFPDAYRTIQAAIDFLTKEKGVKRIYVLGYSMGARMTSSFLANQPSPAVVGFIGVGLLEGGGEPLDANQNVRRIRIPVLDVYADSTQLDMKSADNRQSLVSDNYKQVRIQGAEHSFSGYDSQVTKSVIDWLKEQEKKAGH